MERKWCCEFESAFFSTFFMAICVFIEALAAFFATVMRFLGHSLLVSFSLLLSILYRGGVVFVSHKVACVLKGSLLGFLYISYNEILISMSE
ncbi:hypothetical protein NC651_007898 [Populus alba x Populus x berolinensis]|nr:hypothetical protein NC651_007898 [Populus alba x Populus x berolinensis]